jgi:hypothetical protein
LLWCHFAQGKRHIQQNSWRQREQVMWQQPPFFSIGALHFGQLCTRSLRRNVAFSASSAFCCFLKARQERPA